MDGRGGRSFKLQNRQQPGWFQYLPGNGGQPDCVLLLESVSVTDVSSNIPQEQSLIENILRLNKGKRIKAYVSYPDSSAWQNKVYEGIIEEAGRDHLIIRDNVNNLWYLIRIIYLNYVEFMEPIVYSHSYSEKTY